MPAPQLILTIAPDRDGKTVLHVSLRAADGTLTPARRIPVELDRRLGGLCRRHEGDRQESSSRRSNSQAMGRAVRRDGKPAIAVGAVHGEQIGQCLRHTAQGKWNPLDAPVKRG